MAWTVFGHGDTGTRGTGLCFLHRRVPLFRETTLCEAAIAITKPLSAVSIREFCDFPTPIFMFDKDGNFVVMKLKEVSD